ncbi:MAG: GFA family protein [Pseudomonadota bacterium]
MKDDVTRSGRCHCGAVSWTFDGAVQWACYCHCDDCRRTCAAPVVGWLGVHVQGFRWTGQAPRTRESSPGVLRHFCAGCGTPMAFEATHYPGGMHLYAGTLDAPETFEPTFHVNYQSKLPWLLMADDLPKYNGTLREAAPDLGRYDTEA